MFRLLHPSEPSRLQQIQMTSYQSNTMINHKLYSPTGSIIAMVLLVIIVIMQLQTTESVQPAIAKKGCQDNCGGVQIPYPFGIGSNCFLDGFELTCNATYNRPVLFNVPVQNISLSSGQAHVNNYISSQCYNSTTNNVSYSDYQWNLSGTPFRFNNEKNRFTVIGCDTAAFIYFGNETNNNTGGCILVCSGQESIINGSCSGIGCCQTVIPKQTNYYYVDFASNYNNSEVYNYSRCGYAVLMENDGFVFSSDYITTNKLYGQLRPVVLDWSIGNETCDIAKANRTSYACISRNSFCVSSTNGPGYLCNCSAGYEGNPYLEGEGSCQDIDECAANKPCSKKCHNLPGTYECSCPGILRLKKRSAAGECEFPLAYIIGIGASIILLVLVGFFLYVAFERRKLSKVKKEYFQQYGGRILLEKIKSDMGFSFTIFSKQDVELATNYFDSSNMIGQGGQGIVYKGTIKNRLVAIKKCKFIDESKKKEFHKEMIFLSEINHKNIVKLLGCCLEVEVPMLIYEFISNGTLFHHVHHKKHGYFLALEDRLRIAQESAEALAYLHYSVSPPIFHGDIKSSNILLDENCIAKVSDFGASRLAPTDESQFVTFVQGTCGYLDPEYMQSSQLTDKSDVYSFGVVLLELLTSKPVIDFNATTENKNLSSLFLSAMKENKMYELLDVQIKREEDMELIYRVAELAKECLNMKGEDRPTMKEVAEEIDRIRKLKKHPWGRINYEETENFLGESSIRSEIEHTGNFSIERDVAQSIALGR